MSLASELIKGTARALRQEAGDYARGTEEQETLLDAADALDDAADLLETLNA